MVLLHHVRFVPTYASDELMCVNRSDFL